MSHVIANEPHAHVIHAYVCTHVYRNNRITNRREIWICVMPRSMPRMTSKQVHACSDVLICCDMALSMRMRLDTCVLCRVQMYICIHAHAYVCSVMLNMYHVHVTCSITQVVPTVSVWHKPNRYSHIFKHEIRVSVMHMSHVMAHTRHVMSRVPIAN